MNISDALKNFPLRVSITDYCNLKCFFCSNEGMDSKFRNTAKIDSGKFIYLLKVLKENGLENLSLTGGDPTCYPEIGNLLTEINRLKFSRTFFHTNGISLNESLIKGPLKEFSKVAISIHSVDFLEWKAMTGGEEVQFNKLMNNLKLISKEGYGNKIEIKIVPIKDHNYSVESVRRILDFCDENNFRFKFLIFEPILKEHLSLVVGLKEVASSLSEVGAKELEKDDNFRAQGDYLPINKYKYKSTQGVLIEIGCGKKGVCKSCSESNEIFITPSLEIKPCHASPFVISLMKLIDKKNDEEILNSILKSRGFLKSGPGSNKEYWTQE